MGKSICYCEGLDMKENTNQSLEQEITTLFGETSWQLERRPCRGKYRGHTDYTLVFGSGCRLYVGLDKRNYLNKLRERLQDIRHFREHQAENTEKIRGVLAENDTPFCDAEVGIVPDYGSSYLSIYAVVILHLKHGIRLVYRNTYMHGFLVGYEGSCFSFEDCMAHLLEDSCGEMACTYLLDVDNDT